MCLHQLNYYKTEILQTRLGQSINGTCFAKPILLYVLIDLIEENILKDNKIKIEKICNIYKSYLQKEKLDYVPVAYPFYYLKNDGYWHLKWKNDIIIQKKTPSYKFIMDNVEYAYFDELLWKLLQDKSSRDEIKKTLVMLQNKL